VKVDVEGNEQGSGLLTGGPNFGQSEASGEINDACLNSTVAGEQRRVALHVMLDSSASMLEPAGGGTAESASTDTKWQAVNRAIRNFMIESADSDLSLGLQFFPLPKPGAAFVCDSHADCGPDGGPCFLSTCAGGTTLQLCVSRADCPGGEDCVDFGLCEDSNPAMPLACFLGEGNCQDGLGRCQDFERTCTNATDCNPGRYTEPAVEIAPIAGGYDAVDRALRGKPPEGLTPSGPALQGAITHSREWAAMNPDYTVVTVFVTDGLPTECGPVAGELPAIETVTAVAAEALNGELPIQTFVIGVFQPGDGTSINNVNAIARAGGTGEAVFIDPDGAVDEQFLEALNRIRNGTLSCALQLPDSNEQLDYFRVNLLFDNGETEKQLTYVEGEAGCAQNPDGWHYDVADPTASKPSSIRVCPNVCDQFRDAPDGTIKLQLGCETIVR
jgi:hypothetical protein